MIVKLADNIISPLGVGTRENYEAVKAGRSALRSYPATDLLPTGYFASLIDDSVLEPLYASLGLGQESGYTVFEKRCIACAAAAIREAGIDPSSDRAIFIISTTKANVELLDGHADVGSGEKASADAESKVSADSLPGCHHSVGAGCADRARPDALPDRRTPASAALQVSRYFGNPNTSLVVSNACISGLAAQIEAMRLLDAGTYDYAIVIGADVVEHLWLAHHKAAVDERLVSRSLLAEGPHHSRIVHVKHAKALANDDPGEGDHRAMRPVERDDVIGVHVGYAVTIGEEKGLVAHILLDALDAPGSKGIQAGVRDGDAPRLGSRGVNLYVFRPIAVVKGNV